MFVAGVDPPPDRIEPSPYVVIGEASSNTWYRSVWVIWPIFSAGVIRAEQVVDPGRDRQARVLVGQHGVGGRCRCGQPRDRGRRDEAGDGRGDRDEGEQRAATVDRSGHGSAPC